MTTRVLIQLALVLSLGISETLGDRSFLHLFRARDWDLTDANIHVYKDTTDLSTVNFDDQAHSYHFHGTAIMYEYKNYNADNPGGSIKTMTYLIANSYEKKADPQLAITSSLRILGYNTGATEETHHPSVTLFEKNNFGGLRTELITASKGTLQYTNAVSLVSIGVNAWTFYDEINYGGLGHCVKGSSDETGVQFLGNSTVLGFSLNGKRSVEKGCWARHGVPIKA